MKTKHNCVICNEIFIANHNTNIKTCKTCRGKDIKDRTKYMQSYRSRLIELIDNINSKLNYLKINNRSNSFNLKLNVPCKHIGRGLKNVVDFGVYEEYLEDSIKKLQKELKVIKQLKNN